MYKQIIFAVLILFISSMVSAMDNGSSGNQLSFAGQATSSESTLPNKWIGKLLIIQDESSEENTISTCCFGCPKPIEMKNKSSQVFLPLDYATRIVTKTKRTFSIENENGINYLLVPENLSFAWLSGA